MRGIRLPRLAGLGFVLLLLSVTVVAGCGGKQKPAETVAHQMTEAGPVPTWLSTADKAIVSDYQWAASHHEELQYIPCYCGCGSLGHTSNSTCYFNRDKSGAPVAYDQHAVG